MEYTFVINIGRQSFTAKAHSEEQYEAIKEGFDAISIVLYGHKYEYDYDEPPECLEFTESDYQELQGEAKETFDAFATYNELWVDQYPGIYSGKIVLKSAAMAVLEEGWKEYFDINDATEEDCTFEEYASDFGYDFKIDE